MHQIHGFAGGLSTGVPCTQDQVHKPLMLCGQEFRRNIFVHVFKLMRIFLYIVQLHKCLQVTKRNNPQNKQITVKDYHYCFKSNSVANLILTQGKNSKCQFPSTNRTRFRYVSAHSNSGTTRRLFLKTIKSFLKVVEKIA